MKLNSDIIRSSYLWSKFKEAILEKGYTISDMAKKLNITQPALSRVLNWKVWWSDNFFIKIWKNLWLTKSNIENIFKEADREEFKYKWWEDIFQEAQTREFTEDEVNELIKKRLNL